MRYHRLTRRRAVWLGGSLTTLVVLACGLVGQPFAAARLAQAQAPHPTADPGRGDGSNPLASPPRVEPAQVQFRLGDNPPALSPGVRLAVYDEDSSQKSGEAGSAPTSVRPAVDAATYVRKLREQWGRPKFVFFLTGRQHGYIEPCGCTGLENAKGGLSRRHTFIQLLRDTGWNVVALDVGNQIRRFGKQAEIKFQRTAEILRKLDYAAIGLGPDDLRLSLDGLLAPLSEGRFVCANADIFELNAPFQLINVGGQRIGITAVLGAAELKKINRDHSEIAFRDPFEALAETIPKLRNANYRVLLAHGSVEETRQWVARFPDAFDLVVTAGGEGEPTLEPERVPGSTASIVQVGTKGMYVGLVGVFDNPQQPVRYERVVLDARFPDSPEVMEIFADYQKQLEIHGLAGLGIRPVKHASGHTFVGYEKCGECHTTAFEVFESTPHHHATESLVKPPNSRGSIPRHFDPECLSCHVTGWNPQEYFPYQSGYLSLADTLLHANGCENCHGPGSQHVAVESEEIEVSDAEREELRQQMRLTVEEARKNTCYTCHDLDNSPEFDFDTYWEQVKHKGVD